MNVILFDDNTRDDLLPFTFTRPVSEIRTGILKISEKWEKWLNKSIFWRTAPYLNSKFPFHSGSDNLLICGNLLPDKDLVDQVSRLEMYDMLLNDGELLAVRLPEIAAESSLRSLTDGCRVVQYEPVVRRITYPWDIFSLNAEEIFNDFHLLTAGRKSAQFSKTVGVIHPENVFVEGDVRMEYCTLNASEGPVYIGEGCEIMEGSTIRGPFAILAHSQVKMGAKIYGATTIGPHCKVGGELNNVIVFGFSNKSHDGFLGNSVIGEWCNIGADSNSSNLKNNYADIKAWNYPTGRFINTGLQFCGLMMADHSKCGINTMFNTGTVVGVNCNLFGDGFPRSYIPDFSWGGAQGYKVFEPEKAFEVAQKVMARRGIEFTENEKEILYTVFEMTVTSRKF